MSMRTLCFFFFFLFAPSLSYGDETYDIHPDGHARFFLNDQTFQASWIVRCTRPMRDCAARSSHGLVRVTDEGISLSLFSAAPTPLIMTDVDSEVWSYQRLAGLSPNDIDALNHPETKVVLMGRRGPEALTNLHGIEAVVTYLTWLQTDTARAVRDARLWPDGERLDEASLEGLALFRYRELLRRRAVKSIEVPQITSFIAPP